MKALVSECLLIAALSVGVATEVSAGDQRFVTYTVNPARSNLTFTWIRNQEKGVGTIDQFKQRVEADSDHHLVFATNGGIFKEDFVPVGLYIENGKRRFSLNTGDGKGNFYLKPNGVLSISKNGRASVQQTEDFRENKEIAYATQSGPMLLINGDINSAFTEGSRNLQIRNGVGVLPGNKLVFAISREPVNFYDFALLFKDLGCRDALYLDGFVSAMYSPKGQFGKTDAQFAIVLAVTN